LSHVQASETLVAHVSECDAILNGSSLGVAAALSLLSLVLEVGRAGITCWGSLLHAFFSGIAGVSPWFAAARAAASGL
jgi:hypothetical protein